MFYTLNYIFDVKEGFVICYLFLYEMGCVNCINEMVALAQNCRSSMLKTCVAIVDRRRGQTSGMEERETEPWKRNFYFLSKRRYEILREGVRDELSSCENRF